MKRLNTSYITSGVGMPIKSGTLDFLQDAHKETASEIVTSLMGYTPDDGVVYILSGCKNSDTIPTYTVSAGIVYYNGEIYNVPAFSLTGSGSSVPYPSLLVTQYTTNADTVEFTDGTPRSVHDIRNFSIALATSSTLPKYDDWLRAGAWIYGDTKEIVCTNGYASTMFDSTGLGRLERKGWAIMNGNNGTLNDNGKVTIAYGTDYTTLGATGGSRDAVVVAHTHVEQAASGTGTSNSIVATPTGAGNLTVVNTTASTGVSGTDKNMQPYVVRLRIMKI